MVQMHLTLKDLYNRALEAYPSNIALIYKDQRITYKQLNDQANKLANAFIHAGISVESPVALLMPNCIEFVVADLAIIKSGAVKVPLNSMLGEEEIFYMLENSEAEAVIADPRFYPILEKIKGKLPRLKYIIGIAEQVPKGFLSLNEFIKNAGEDVPQVEVSPKNRAAIPFSGGTTGKSKGIVQIQEAMVMSLYCHLIELEIAKTDKILIMSPLTHSAGRFVMTGLLRGATHYIHDKFDPVAAIQTILEEEITVTFMVPTMIYRVIDAIHENQLNVNGHKLRMIGYAASPIMEERLKQGLDLFGPVFYQFYGQTECPNFITRLTKEDHIIEEGKSSRLRSCGKPSIMSEVKIVDLEGNELPAGEQGEIIVRSPFIMKEYHRLPDKTEETLRNGWLHTGDIGMMDEEGYVYIVDRKNDMIISGGMNVYSTEVENAIQEYPGVRQVAVIGIPHSDWGEQVIAFVVPDPSNQPKEEHIIAFCKGKLAKYKQPKQIKFVDSLPLTPIGKIDKKALRQPYWAHTERAVN